MSFLCKYMCCVKVYIINVKDHCHTLSWGWEANAVSWFSWSDCCHWRLWLFRFINLQHWVHMAAPHMLAAQGYVLQEVLEGKESTWKPQPRGCRCRAVLAKGTRYHRKGEEQCAALLHIQHWNTPAPTCSSRAPVEAPSPCHSTQTGKRALTALYDWLQMFSCDPGSALSFPHLSSALSSFFGVQPHSHLEHHTSTEVTHCLMPRCHSLPSTSLQLRFFHSSPAQRPAITRKHFSQRKAPASTCYLVQDRDIPLKGAEIFLWNFCSHQWKWDTLHSCKKTSSGNPAKTQKKAKPQSQQTFFSVLA